MKEFKCDMCDSKAAYVLNTGMHLCEDCFLNMEDDFVSSFEDDLRCYFYDYYDAQSLDEN